MSTLSLDSLMPRQFSYTFLHPPNVSEVPTRMFSAGPRVNRKASTNSFPTGPLGPLNHSLLTFRRALCNWVRISCLLHSTTFNDSHCLLWNITQFCAGIEDPLRTRWSPCSHPHLSPLPVLSTAYLWSTPWLRHTSQLWLKSPQGSDWRQRLFVLTHTSVGTGLHSSRVFTGLSLPM